MGIRSKTVLIIIALLTATVLGFAMLAQAVLVRGFVQVETAEMQKNVNRGVDAVNYNLEQVSVKSADWGYWDDTYNFVQGKNKNYVEVNLTPSAVTGLRLNYMMFYDAKGKLVAAPGYDLATSEPLPKPTSLINLLAAHSELLAVDNEDSQKGIVMLPEGPMMVVTQPIMRSDASGPRAGTLISAVYIDAAKAKELSDLSHLPLSFYPYDGKNLPADVKAYHNTGNKGVSITPLNDNTVAGYSVMKDMFGQPGLLVRTEQPRSIYDQGRKTLTYFVGAIVGIGLLLAVVLTWLLNRFVSGPVRRLDREVGAIGGSDKNRGGRVHQPKSRDEVGRLAGSINVMLAGLQEARDQLAREKDLVEQKVVERTRELAEAQAELAASVRSLPFGFAVVNNEDEIIFSNALLSKLANEKIPDDRVKSRPALKKIHNNYASVMNLLGDIHKAREERRPIERQINFGPKYFRFFFMPVSGASQADKVLGTVVIMQDVTEEKAIQRSRDEFFSIASHELRTPLTAIRGNSDMLLNYFKEQLKNVDMHQMVTDVHDASLRLIGVVNDFLDMSRLELGKVMFKKEDFDTAELISEIMREYKVTGLHNKVTLAFNPGAGKLPLVRSDKNRVRQIIVNLVGNGIKATTEGGVTVSTLVDNHVLKIRVTDTGKGIPAASQHLLFHKFQQAEDSILTRDATQSTGLGLYISRMLAEGMGGKLYLENSEVGKGSTFTLELPISSNNR